MRAKLISFTMMLVLVASPACSVYKASTQPGPADLTGLGIGSRRSDVIAKLGTPKFSDTDPEGQKQDTYEFDSGLHQGSKARVILYLAADIFTLTLAEIILWPLELTVMESAKCVGSATYDLKHLVKTWSVTQKGGVQGC
jgi:hypothetical protein